MQLPYAIENAVARFQLDHANERLQAELKSANESLEERVKARTNELEREITERKQAEEALRESQRTLTTLVSNLPGVVYRGDKDWTTSYISDGVYALTGYTAAEFMDGTIHITSLMHPDDLGPVGRRIQAAIDARQPYEAVSRIRTRSGQEKWIWEKGRGIYAPDWTLQFLEGFVVDITEQKQTEEALHAAESRLRLALEAGRIGIWDWDMVTGTIVWSRGHEELWGMAPGAFRGTYEEFDARLHPDDRAGLNRAVAESLAERRTYRHEYRVVWPDGSTHWIAGHGEPFFDQKGKPVRMLGVVMDITERKRAEEALRESERTLATLICNLPGVVYRCRNDRDWTAVFVSDGMLALTGYPSSEFIEGRIQVGSLIHPDDRETVWGTIQKALAARESYEMTYRMYTAGGDERWVWERGMGIFSDAGELLFLEGFVLDITERKQAEEALRRSHEDLEIAQERAHLGSWVLDLATLTGTWSKEMCRLHGRDPSQGAPSFPEFLELVHPDDRQRLADTHAHLVRHGGSATLDYRTISDGRPERVISATVHCVKDADGNVVRMVGTNLDVTDRKQAEAQIRTLIDNVPGAVYRCGYAPNWTIEFMSDPIRDISGYPASDFVNDSVRSYVSIIEPSDWLAVERIAKECLSKRHPYEVEYRIRHADGSQRWIYEKGQGVFDVNGVLRWLDGVILDVTERKRAEEALQEHGRRLHLLSQRLVTVQEGESRRIGRELHDDLGQILTTLKLSVQTLPLQAGLQAVRTRIDDLTGMIDQAIERVRSLSADLRPTVLDDLGLVAALRWMLDQVSRHGLFKGTLAVRGLEGRLSPELETTCFRVVQEALTNVVRHARAKRVWVELEHHGTDLQVRVRDDGVGFDLEQVVSEHGPGHNLGLLGMQERAAVVDGRLTIQSAPGEGTEVRAWFPLRA